MIQGVSVMTSKKESTPQVDQHYAVVWTLFTAYGKGNETDRMRIYTMQLKVYEAEVVHEAVTKFMRTKPFLPALSELFDACKDIEERNRRLAIFDDEGWQS